MSFFVLNDVERADEIDRIDDKSVKRAGVGIIPALAICCFLTGSAFASDGFDDGSFDGAAPSPGQEAAQSPAAEGEDGFDDGSFGGGGSFDDGTQPPARDEAQADDGDGGSFDGSFDDVADGDAGQPDPVRKPDGNAPAGGGDDFGDGGDFDRPDQVAEDEVRDDPKRDDEELTELPPDGKPDSKGGPIDDRTPPIDEGILAFETRDFGVPPTNKLRSSHFHAPTPTSIPGGLVVTTSQLAEAMQIGQEFLLIDVLGGQYALPNAFSAPAMARPGNYRDRIQQQTNQWLDQITGGNNQVALVIYCSDPHCWLSYNASLRAIAAGYANVYWYRGGLQAWKMAGLQLTSSGF